MLVVHNERTLIEFDYIWNKIIHVRIFRGESSWRGITFCISISVSTGEHGGSIHPHDLTENASKMNILHSFQRKREREREREKFAFSFVISCSTKDGDKTRALFVVHLLYYAPCRDFCYFVCIPSFCRPENVLFKFFSFKCFRYLCRFSKWLRVFLRVFSKAPFAPFRGASRVTFAPFEKKTRFARVMIRNFLHNSRRVDIVLSLVSRRWVQLVSCRVTLR